MDRRLYQLLVFLGLVISLLCLSPPVALAQSNSAELSKAVQEIENLDAMRSSLASTLVGKAEAPTLQTMKEVCRPVGMRVVQLGQEKGWQVKQIAAKYRNPDHAPDSLQASNALAKFQEDPDLMGFWQQGSLGDQPGTRYYRRITIEQGCLGCHGARTQRPQFVKEHYPQDLAYDFQVGDLRGMYAVFIPDVQAALQKAL